MFVFLALLPALLALASPVEKRYNGVKIQAARDGKCLSVSGAVQNGSPVISGDCASASTWNINPGSGSVTLASNAGFALDAGSNPGNNGGLKIWQSYPGLYQQTWYLTGDQRIAITGGNQCLDEGNNGIQTYQCTTGNTNQVFNIVTGGGDVSSKSVTPSSTSKPSTPSSSPTSSSAIPSGSVYPDPAPGGGRRIHPKNRPDLCVTILGADQERDPPDGTQVAIAYCEPIDGPNTRFQLWDIGCPGSTGNIQLHGGGASLAAGTTTSLPSNGNPVVIRKDSNQAQQTWTFNTDGRLTISNGQSLNIKAESGKTAHTPVDSLKDLQTWNTDGNDINSLFFLTPQTGKGAQC